MSYPNSSGSSNSSTVYNARDLNYSFFSSIQGLTQSLPDLYKCYVETDASGSKSVYSMAPHFKDIYSIQLHSKTAKKLILENTGDKVKYYSNSGSSLSSLNSICGNLSNDTCFYMNYNNYSQSSDCLVEKYVRAVVSRCKKKCIIIIDSFGLIDECFSTMGNHSEELRKKITDSCGSRLTNDYDVGSKSGGRYRLVLHLDKITE
jgi:hypothetical protein